MFSVWLCHRTKGACLYTACQIWLTCSHLSLKPLPHHGSGGPGHEAPEHSPIFQPHLFCIWWAHWMAEKMFCDLGNLLETNWRAQVQCNWTAGCPVEWGKSDAAQAEGMKQEFISLVQKTHSTLLAQGVHIHRQKHICLLFLCKEILGPQWMSIFTHKPSLSNLHWWVCPMWICKCVRMRRQFALTDLRYGKGLLVHWGVSPSCCGTESTIASIKACEFKGNLGACIKCYSHFFFLHDTCKLQNLIRFGFPFFF